MTLKQIKALILDDIKLEVQGRVFLKKDPSPIQPDPLPEDFDSQVWYDSQFTQEELDAEFLVLKEELIVQETERLRKVDIKDRFNNLSDMRLTFHTLYPNIPNPSIFLRDLMNQVDHVDTETKIAELEAKDIELQTSPEKIQGDYIAERNLEYNKAGVTRDMILEAIWEKQVEGRSEKSDALQVIRLDVKSRVPKPV